MKKFAAILMLLVASTTAFVGCSGNKEQVEAGSGEATTVAKAPLEELLAAMIEAGTVRMPMPVDETLAQEAYHIDLETVEEYAIAETGIAPGPGLIVMAKAKEGQLDAVKANMQKLLDAKIGNAFYPEEKDAAEQAEILVDGNYVALFIVNGEVEETVMNMFKESK